MDIRLESAEEADKAPDSDEVSPEERLQRLVLNSLRAEQEQPVDAPAVASPEPVRAETGGWRGLNLFLALVIAGAAAGGSLLLIIGQHDFGQDAPPRSTIATGPIHAASLPAPLPAHCRSHCRPHCRPRSRSPHRRFLRNSRPDLRNSLSNPGPSRFSRITRLQAIPILQCSRREGSSHSPPNQRNKWSKLCRVQRQPPRHGRTS